VVAANETLTEQSYVPRRDILINSLARFCMTLFDSRLDKSGALPSFVDFDF